ncbi:MAG: response regulator transcription factor [Oscillospiraceae bacterium]|jgi:DNA-binding NarL/FixJ family response regulator
MRVLVVDDDRLVASSLKTILEADKEIEVVGTLSSGADAVAQFASLAPDVLLMDIRMEGMTGLDAAQEILKGHPDAKILFLTTFSDDEYIARALAIGAKGYILKQNFESIAPSLKTVCAGQRVFGDEIVTKLPSVHGGSGLAAFGLTEREKQLLSAVAEGLSNKEIAEKLYLGEGTVRNYVSSLLDKLALRDRTQLAVFYYKHS